MAKTSWIWKETAEVLGVLGVVGSLIFVALEIRQNTDAVRSATIQGVLDQSFAVNMIPVDNPGLREALYAAPDELNDDQRRQLGWFYAGMLRVQMNRFYQAQVGVFDEAALVALGGRAGAYQLPTFVSWWATQGGRYSPEFEEFVDRIVNGEPVNMDWFDPVDPGFGAIE